MYTFGQLYIGDLFNTKAARWVKISSHEALSVMSGCFAAGEMCRMGTLQEVVVLWSNNPAIKSASAAERESDPHASLSESEKEDRFYRKIEAEIGAENRERQAAEFLQSLVDERDALVVRRECVSRHMNDRSVRGTELYWLSEQYNVMYNYIAALNARISLLDQPAKQTV